MYKPSTAPPPGKKPYFTVNEKGEKVVDVNGLTTEEFEKYMRDYTRDSEENRRKFIKNQFGQFDVSYKNKTIDFKTRPPYDDAADAAANAYSTHAKKRIEDQFRDGGWTEHVTDTGKTMSNKFLPFIVESSSPLNIFKTLLSRSKGMNRVLIASIFNLTLQVDIKKLRDFVKSLPEMPLEKCYEELMTKYAKYRINGEDLVLFTNMSQFLPKDSRLWDEKLSEFEQKDIMLFFCVLCHWNGNMHEYSGIDWSVLYDNEDVFNNLSKYIKLSDSGNKVYVKTQEELKAFIVYVAKLFPKLPDSVPSTASYCIVMGDQS